MRALFLSERQALALKALVDYSFWRECGQPTSHIFRDVDCLNDMLETVQDPENIARCLLDYSMRDVKWQIKNLTDAEKVIVGTQANLNALHAWANTYPDQSKVKAAEYALSELYNLFEDNADMTKTLDLIKGGLEQC